MLKCAENHRNRSIESFKEMSKKRPHFFEPPYNRWWHTHCTLHVDPYTVHCPRIFYWNCWGTADRNLKTSDTSTSEHTRSFIVFIHCSFAPG